MITETLRDSITTESNSKFTLLISSKLPLATTICLTPLPYVLPARVCSIFVYLKSCLKPGCLIIDVSCDEGMGFYFAKPTTFKNPMFKIGMVDYYAVDHTPSYLWESASRSLSAALVVHLPTVLEGADGWQQNATIRNAINIDAGVIQKPDIISFQKRQPFYLHAPIDTGRTDGLK